MLNFDLKRYQILNNIIKYTKLPNQTKSFLLIIIKLNMSQPIFHYFDARGRGEEIRILLNYAGVKYTEVKIGPLTDEIRSKLTFGQLPWYQDGSLSITQSMAIESYIARKYNLLGVSEEENAEIFSYVLSVADMLDAIIKAFTGGDEQKQNFSEKIAPRIIKAWESKINDQGHLFGNKTTWADLAIFNSIDYLLWTKNENLFISSPKCIKLHKSLANSSQLKPYLDSRPKDVKF
ncbi:putative glutathione S-transferase [Heterostelium album PN500]|uniref:Putative glutathione S-transferase n=1 Tax=Heterostelium pallidum (strain ATCC 26659 / Pp 5 / PN500) TaxID=670386 RepID=D3BPF4_HETP5|nr:putative glutathione S-transferase [Heterostelium album PN500]EFA76672.1 putative glutathione S-transferase [Heterostelium album PN500]|eukprot:XP_020428804.1 putative glutathione S-transferase [Heterostelium album PN500]